MMAISPIYNKTRALLFQINKSLSPVDFLLFIYLLSESYTRYTYNNNNNYYYY